MLLTVKVQNPDMDTMRDTNAQKLSAEAFKAVLHSNIKLGKSLKGVDENELHLLPKDFVVSLYPGAMNPGDHARYVRTRLKRISSKAYAEIYEDRSNLEGQILEQWSNPKRYPAFSLLLQSLGAQYENGKARHFSVADLDQPQPLSGVILFEEYPFANLVTKLNLMSEIAEKANGMTLLDKASLSNFESALKTLYYLVSVGLFSYAFDISLSISNAKTKEERDSLLRSGLYAVDVYNTVIMTSNIAKTIV